MKTLLRRSFRGSFVLVWLAASWAAASDGQVGFQFRTFRDAAGDHGYAVFIPKAYSTDKPWPTILFLHSASERGRDGQLPVRVGLGPAIRERQETFPFIAVFPQCEDLAASVKQGWSPGTPDGDRALAILAEVAGSYRVDPNRIYLTGASMGGYGVWAQAAATPERWAAIVPLCGGGDPARAAKLAKLPTWCFHGAKDRAVLPEESRRMIDAIKSAGGQPRFSELPGVEHNVWDVAYRQDDLYAWLSQQRRGVAEQASDTPPARSNATTASPREEPFVPVLHVANAAYARLGNDLLKSLGYVLAEMAPADSLSGKFPDQDTTTNTPVGPMSVRFRGLQYRGTLGPASLSCRGDGTMSLGLTARNVVVTIRRTSISGAGRSAKCGPIRITLGNQSPLRLQAVVRPSVQQDRLRLQVVDAQFRLSPDNMAVDGPEWVNARGGGMTSERVSSALRDGFYSEPQRLEEQVVQALPAALDRFASNLPLDRANQLVASVWPMPVYKPRVRLWPSSVSVDAQGATVGLGITVAAVTDEQAARATNPVKRIDLAANGPPPETGTEFRFAIAASVLKHLSEPLAEAGVARVLVVDTPLKQLQILALSDTLVQILPEVRQRPNAEFRAEIVLASPVQLLRVTDGDPDHVELNVPKVVCAITMRDRVNRVWTPYFDVEFNVRQRAKPELMRPTYSTRTLVFGWHGDSTIDVRGQFASGVVPMDPRIDESRLQAAVTDAWRDWTVTSPLSETTLHDLQLGTNPSRFRPHGLAWNGEYLTATFAPAGIVVRSKAEGTVAYETKSALSTWGGPYKVAAGQRHAFPLAESFICRFRSAGQEKMYTLGSGQRFEFRTTGTGGEVDLVQLSDTAE